MEDALIVAIYLVLAFVGLAIAFGIGMLIWASRSIRKNWKDMFTWAKSW